MADDNSTQLAISLPRFAGPFDLLLSLIRHNQYAIDDLPVGEITRQFLDYARSARDLDAELGGEFVEVASWLVLLKSRSMLPVDESDGPTPREELRRAMLDHSTLASATEFLRSRGSSSRHGGAGADLGHSEQLLSSDVAPTVQDLIEATRRAMEAARVATSFRATEIDSVTVEDQIRWVAERLASLNPCSVVATADWFAIQPGDGSRAVLLLAMLELARKGILLLHQSGPASAIRVKALCAVSPDLEIDAFAHQSAAIAAN